MRTLLVGLALALGASSPAWSQQCDWSNPGSNPYTGTIADAVDRYVDIPPGIRATLKRRMAARQYDELVTITRDEIISGLEIEAKLYDMHWGESTVCKGAVNRAAWSPRRIERALVYCESTYCLVVPTICRNVARVRYVEGSRVTALSIGDDGGAGTNSLRVVPEPGALFLAGFGLLMAVGVRGAR